MKEITLELPKIIQHTFRNTICSRADFASPCNIDNFDGIENGGPFMPAHITLIKCIYYIYIFIKYD